MKTASRFSARCRRQSKISTRLNSISRRGEKSRQRFAKNDCRVKLNELWIKSGFGLLNEIKKSIIALTLAVAGIQTVFSSFVLIIPLLVCLKNHKIAPTDTLYPRFRDRF